MRPGTLRWRLGLIYALVIAAALSVVLVVTEVAVERALIDNTAARLEVEAGLINPTTGRGNAQTTSLAADEVARLLGGQQTAVVILDGSGRALASEANGAPQGVLDARLEPATYGAIVSDGRTVDRVLAPGASGGRVLLVAAPVRFAAASPAEGAQASPQPKVGKPSTPPGQGRGLGRGQGNGKAPELGGAASGATGPPNAVAQLAVSLDEVDATLAGLRGTLLMVGFGALLAAFGAAMMVTALGLRPLGRIAEVADRVAAGDLSVRAGLPSGSDEIGRLGRAFDRMIERLESAFAAQRQFAADASHELRSPLTVLGGYVDVLARGAHEVPDAAGRILASMRAEIDRLSRLASDLLLLTQLEAGGGRLAPEALDLGDLLVDLGEAGRVMRDGQRIEVERVDSLPVVVDRDRLTQALLNLVDNAVRHARPEGLVRLTGRRDGRSAVVEVFNEGPQIDADSLAHVFDRFYRADRSVEPGLHAGLGLAIVKAIVDASGGEVSATSEAHGTTFTVRLPLVPTADSQQTLSRTTGPLQEAHLP
ncbi:MAG TPA: HAMP domain-containing sensor histidine kinase [Candidatus Limnocylindrales bacterium]